jgi:nucleobase:cation symporter-1, NCS1 family
VLAGLTLVAITLGAISANAINIYSGSLSFVTLGVRLPFPVKVQRAAVAATFGVIGLVVAYFGLRDVGQSYEAFLLIIAYWIGPWLGVVLTDQYLRRAERTDSLLFDTAHRGLAGPVAMLVGLLLSVWLFSDQEAYVGVVPGHLGSVGDITFAVGFAIASVTYGALRYHSR